MKELMQKMQQLETLEHDIRICRDSKEARETLQLKITGGKGSVLTFVPVGSYNPVSLETKLFCDKENRDLLDAYIQKVADRADTRREELQAELTKLMIESALKMGAATLSPFWLSCGGKITGPITDDTPDVKRFAKNPENQEPVAVDNAKASWPRIKPGETMACAVKLPTARPSPHLEDKLLYPSGYSFQQVSKILSDVSLAYGYATSTEILQKVGDVSFLVDLPSRKFFAVYDACRTALQEGIVPASPTYGKAYSIPTPPAPVDDEEEEPNYE